MAKALNDNTVCIEKLLTIEDYPIWKFWLQILFEANNLYKVMTTDKPVPKRMKSGRKKMQKLRKC